ncbi:hypothetical protein L0337_33865 [candidate division KSB1 bacterium]|nr:hypothetical protein [candidate division KSB1 bacterium]
MKHFTKKFAIATFASILAIFIFQPVYAQTQPEDRTFGLSASFQESQFDIILPFWIEQRAVLAPAISAVYAEDIGTDLGAGLVFRGYFGMRKVTPYLGARFGALISMPSRSDSITDFFFGLLYGGEFFLDPHFSIGVEAQANLVKSDEKSTRFGNPGGVNINTAAAVIVNAYF